MPHHSVEPLNCAAGRFILVILLVLCSPTTSTLAVTTRPISPPGVKTKFTTALARPQSQAPPLSPLVARLLKDPITLASQKVKLKIFHGQWNRLPASLTPAQQAHLALLQFKLKSPILRDANINPRWRAQAALYRGQPKQALALLATDKSPQAALIKARAFQQLGKIKQAVAVLKPIRPSLDRYRQSAPQLTAAAEALILLARLQGQPAADYQQAMNMLGRAHEQLDPLYWPALVAEADALMSRDNLRDAMQSLAQALSLNPKASRAWYDLGVIGVETYNFDRATLAIKQLRAINSHHLLADQLQARLALTEKDIPTARRVLTAALKTYPNQRHLLALKAATEALADHPQDMRQTLARLDTLAPGSPHGMFVVGRTLSRARQYAQAADMLRQAIGREPHWPAPHVELGLLLMQWGKLHQAEIALRKAASLDPFNRQVHNQLALVQSMLAYPTIQTPHFVIRYPPGIDSVLAHDMPGPLEKMYAQITSDFQYQPKVKTEIDLMPNEHAFAVRITGMPDIWTIAACMGSVISLTPPKNGASQSGPFNWVNVIRHEFTHTVTLGQTHNRVPHWFTEACAVSEQLNRRSYDDCQLLAWALQKHKLFTLDQINWGFVRPKHPYSRQLAYAQARWMLQFINDRWSHQAVIDLLNLYDNDVGNLAAIKQVTHLTPNAFMQHFQAWARQQVAGWGLAPAHLPKPIEKALRGQAPPPTLKQVAAALKAQPSNPDLLKLYAQKLLHQHPLPPGVRQAILRYARARPVDPWAQRALVDLAVKQNHLRQAIQPLITLNKCERQDGQWAYQLAKIQRHFGHLQAAARALLSAVHHEPFNPTYRELAATVDLQIHRPRRALTQLQALAELEPHLAIHQVQLASLYTELHEPAKAAVAAKRARKLDPHAPIARFLKASSPHR